jgi:hypothetical protein
MKRWTMISVVGLLTLYLLPSGLSIAQEAGSDVESVLRGRAGYCNFLFECSLILGCSCLEKERWKERPTDEKAGDEGDD